MSNTERIEQLAELAKEYDRLEAKVDEITNQLINNQRLQLYQVNNSLNS